MAAPAPVPSIERHPAGIGRTGGDASKRERIVSQPRIGRDRERPPHLELFRIAKEFVCGKSFAASIADAFVGEKNRWRTRRPAFVIALLQAPEPARVFEQDTAGCRLAANPHHGETEDSSLCGPACKTVAKALNPRVAENCCSRLPLPSGSFDLINLTESHCEIAVGGTRYLKTQRAFALGPSVSPAHLPAFLARHPRLEGGEIACQRHGRGGGIAGAQKPDTATTGLGAQGLQFRTIRLQSRKDQRQTTIEEGVRQKIQRALVRVEKAAGLSGFQPEKRQRGAGKVADEKWRRGTQAAVLPCGENRKLSVAAEACETRDEPFMPQE